MLRAMAVPSSTRPEVLVVSKPLDLPWNDGSKNLARDLVVELERRQAGRVRWFAHAPTLELGGEGRIHVPAPRLSRATAATMLARLALERRCSIWHFVFAPNPRTSSLARRLSAMRSRAVVQTVASAPAETARLRQVLFGDRVVVLSRAMERRALGAGLARESVVRIPPATRAPRTPGSNEVEALRARGEGRRLILFPGDLEHGDGADVILAACASSPLRTEIVLAFACRAKTPRAEERQRVLELRARALGVATIWIGETRSIHAWLAAAHVVALPTNTLFAKVDHPLVLLEALHLGRPVIVTRGTAAYELAEDGAALGVEHAGEAVASAIEALLSSDSKRGALEVAGRDYARRELSPERMARAYESVYEGLSP